MDLHSGITPSGPYGMLGVKCWLAMCNINALPVLSLWTHGWIFKSPVSSHFKSTPILFAYSSSIIHLVLLWFSFSSRRKGRDYLQILHIQSWGYSTLGKALALCVTDPGLIPQTPEGPLNLVRHDLWSQSQKKTLSTAWCGPKIKHKLILHIHFHQDI